ncbi:hypothetical protein TNCT_56111, partial [Trichonephila clavata]
SLDLGLHGCCSTEFGLSSNLIILFVEGEQETDDTETNRHRCGLGDWYCLMRQSKEVLLPNYT